MNLQPVWGADLRRSVLCHFLRIFGFDGLAFGGQLEIISGDEPDRHERLRRAVGRCRVVVLLQPGADMCEPLGISLNGLEQGIPVVYWVESVAPGIQRNRSLHHVCLYDHPSGTRLAAVAEGQDGRGAAWLVVELGGSVLLVIGSAVAEDIVRYRQGDPAQATLGQAGLVAGFAHERANYLFESQRAGEAMHERHADVIAASFSWAVARLLDAQLAPLLPDGVPGAVVVTGDDDQAYIERYAEQLALLEDLPITYFLHPLTRLTPRIMRRLFAGRRIELGLHPDALEDPDNYASLLSKQARWFRRLTGTSALSVRNHGFLSTGYWEQAADWRAEGILISSNVTAVDGTALTGSYLPARLTFGNRLTDQWSILTAIGDGLLFAHNFEPEAAADKIRVAGQAIVQSHLPGILVFNMHPQNVDVSAPMHRAILDLVDEGFLPWTLRDCIEWFLKSEQGSAGLRSHSAGGLWDRLKTLKRYLKYWASS